jgi:hypothetical protein
MFHIGSEHRVWALEFIQTSPTLFLHLRIRNPIIGFRWRKALSFAGAEQHASSASQLAKQKR